MVKYLLIVQYSKLQLKNLVQSCIYNWNHSKEFHTEIKMFKNIYELKAHFFFIH